MEASNARTAYEYEVFATKPLFAYVALVVVAIIVPSRMTLYPVTATLSVDVAHARFICVWEVGTAVRPVGTDGAVVSGVVFKVAYNDQCVVPCDETAGKVAGIAAKVRLACVRITPLGSPVVPEV